MRGIRWFSCLHYSMPNWKRRQNFNLVRKIQNITRMRWDTTLLRNGKSLYQHPLLLLQLTPPPQSNIDPAKIRKCQQIHDMQVEILEAFGVDACRAYEQNKVENVIEAVQVADKECPLCKKALKGGGAAIKSHIRARHMDSTPFMCTVCNKSFGNNRLLQEHKTHRAKNFPCTSQGCKLSFPTLGRLNSHVQTHDAKNVVKCQFCPKTFNAKKNLAPHEKTCPNNPAGKVKDKQCPYCPKAYYHQKDLKYHLTKSHASRAGHKDS